VNPRCATKNCRHRCAASGKSPYCARCRYRRFAAKFPLKAAFNNLRKRAKQRGHEFTLTYPEYQDFCYRTGYDILKGKQAFSLTIHRVDDSRGYSVDNIRAVRNSTNVRFRYTDYGRHITELEAEEIAKSANSDPY
jgi:hypothetical protein